MKKIFTFLLVMVLVTSVSIAQQNQTTESQEELIIKQRNDAETDELNNVLKLSEEQKLSIENINKNSAEKLNHLRKIYQDKSDNSGMREEINSIQNKRWEDIHSVLTPEQRKQWRDYQIQKNAK